MKAPFILVAILVPLFSLSQPVDLSNVGGIYVTPSCFKAHHDKMYFFITYLPHRGPWVFDPHYPKSATNPSRLASWDEGIYGQVSDFRLEYDNKILIRGVDSTYLYDDMLPFSSSNPRAIAKRGDHYYIYNNKLYYTIGSGNAYKLWVYDSALPLSSTNPHMLVPYGIGGLNIDGGYFFDACEYNDKLYFSNRVNSAKGFELAVYDDAMPVNQTNPKELYDINTDVYDNWSSSSAPRGFLEYSGKLYFIAVDSFFSSNGPFLWSYDGDTLMKVVRKVDVAYDNQKPIIYHNKIYLAVTDSLGGELWCYDTVNGARRVADIRTGPRGSNPTDMIVYGDRLIIAADDSIHGRELWCYNDNEPVSASNPFLIYDMFPGTRSGTVTPDLEILGDKLYFSASYKNDTGSIYVMSLCDIKVLPRPAFSLGNDMEIFVGQSISLEGPANMDYYEWNIGSSNNSQPFTGETNNIGDNYITLTITDSNYCTYTDTLVVKVSQFNSINDVSDNIQVYPNPSEQHINIVSTETINSIQVFDAVGKKVFDLEPQSKNVPISINIPGIYISYIKTLSGTGVKKIVIE